MPGIFVFATAPAPQSTIGRRQRITGGIQAFNGSIFSVTIRFGDTGTPVNITPAQRDARHGISWAWDGVVPTTIRPGQGFSVLVHAAGAMVVKDGPEPETQDVDGQATLPVVLENVVPVLTMAPVQSPISILDPAHEARFAGTLTEANPAVYGTPQLQYRLDNGPPTAVAITAGAWTVGATLPPGDHTLLLQASDAFGTITTISQPVTVLRYPMPLVTDPATRRTQAGIPTTSSVTSWNRLEPWCADADIGTSSGARLLDPLWMMTRQWQMGEFQGEDAGTPIMARVRATTATLTRCHLGPLPASGESGPGGADGTGGGSAADTAAGMAYDPARTPLEVLVERRPARPAGAGEDRMLATAVDAGLHFLRMLDADPVAAGYRAAFLTRYALLPPAAAVDEETGRFVRAMAGRALDARLVAAALRPPGDTQVALDPALGIADGDLPAVIAVAAAWLAWYDALFSEPQPDTGDAWTPSRMEYAVSVAAPLGDAGPVTFTASGYGGGGLDWSSFDLDGGAGLDTTGDPAATSTVTAAVPAPVVVRGAPAPRFWEMEDATLAYGLLPVGPTDLAHLMLIEYVSGYGNDWYVLPLSLPVGSVTRVDALVVIDTFGVAHLVRPIGDPALPSPYFSLWQSTDMRRPGEPLGQPREASVAGAPRVGAPVANRLLLPPSIGPSVDGVAAEDVLFMRDEMADMAWAIEQVVETPLEGPRRQSEGPLDADPAAAVTGTGAPRYQLSSAVADNWIPLLPVQTQRPGDPVVVRLRPAAVLQPDGSGRVHGPTSQVLAADPALLIYDEEVPREGVRISRNRRMVRWTDGSTWLWSALRKRVGRGEGSSGLVFDQLQESDPPPA